LTLELSYLVRMGSGKHPQCVGRWWQTKQGGWARTLDETVSTCAIGAAAAALMTLTEIAYLDLFAVIAEARDAAGRAGLNIVHLNDIVGLTREAIADLLDALPDGSPTVTVGHRV
jgi:hypothetical protein